MKRTVIGLGVIAAVTAGLLAIAVAGAQEGTPTPNPESGEATHELYRGEFLDKLAENLGVTRENLETAIDDAASATVDDAVANGDIDQERADIIKEHIAEGEGFVPFFGPGPRGGPDGPGRGGFFFHGDLFETAADTLGMTVEDLMSDLRGGKTIADVAAEKNVSVDDLTADVLAAAKSGLDEKVAAGDLEQERADEIYATLSDHIADIINGEGPLQGGPRPFRPFFNGDGRPFHNDSGDDSGEGTGTSTSASGA